LVGVSFGVEVSEGVVVAVVGFACGSLIKHLPKKLTISLDHSIVVPLHLDLCSQVCEVQAKTVRIKY